MKRVFVNGVFDLLHLGHIKLFEAAYQHFPGEEIHLVVAIDSDERVKKLKGPNRPINNLETRLAILQSLRQIDIVFSFDTSEELLTLLKSYKPDLMIKGADYIGKNIIGAEYCKEILFVDLTDDSTTKTLERISCR